MTTSRHYTNHEDQQECLLVCLEQKLYAFMRGLFIIISVSGGRSTANFGTVRKRVTLIATQLAIPVQTTDSGRNDGNGGTAEKASCFHISVVYFSWRMCW